VLREFLKSPTTEQLSKLSQDSQPGQAGNQDLLYVLLEVYASDQLESPEIESKVNTLEKIMVSKFSSKTQDFSFQWLSQYVIRLYNEFEHQINEEDQQASASAQAIAQPPAIMLVEDRCFDQLTINYANQLVREQKFELALALCLYIENEGLQNQFTANLVGLTAGATRGRSQAAKQEMDSVMHQVLGLPPSMLLGHMANANQSAGNFNAALGQFLTIGDAGSALQIFSGHLCPLYFGSSDLVNSLKI